MLILITSRCVIPQIESINSSTYSIDSAILSQYIPLKADGEIDSCKRYSEPFGNASNVVSCDGQFVYDTSIYYQSRVYEVFDFIGFYTIII